MIMVTESDDYKVAWYSRSSIRPYHRTLQVYYPSIPGERKILYILNCTDILKYRKFSEMFFRVSSPWQNC